MWSVTSVSTSRFAVTVFVEAVFSVFDEATATFFPMLFVDDAYISRICTTSLRHKLIDLKNQN